jgi:hypothetical protein
MGWGRWFETDHGSHGLERIKRPQNCTTGLCEAADPRGTLNPAMTWPPKIRGWKAFVFLAAILAVLLLFLPTAADHHNTVLFLLVPIFLFIERIDCSGSYPPREDQIVTPNRHVRFTLFQRPPPSQI